MERKANETNMNIKKLNVPDLINDHENINFIIGNNVSLIELLKSIKQIGMNEKYEPNEYFEKLFKFITTQEIKLKFNNEFIKRIKNYFHKKMFLKTEIIEVNNLSKTKNLIKLLKNINEELTKKLINNENYSGIFMYLLKINKYCKLYLKNL